MSSNKLGKAILSSTLYDRRFRPAKIYNKNGKHGEYYRCRGYYFYYKIEWISNSKRSIKCNGMFFKNHSLLKLYVQNHSYYLMLELKGAL